MLMLFETPVRGDKANRIIRMGGCENWNLQMFELQGVLKELNKRVFGNIFTKRRELVYHLKHLDSQINLGWNASLVKNQEDTWKLYEEILANEELLWFQKSRAKWLEYGDRNTHYFHGVTTIRCQRNNILAFQNDNGNWIREPEQLERLPIDFYANLFRNDSCFIPFCVQGRFARLSEEECNHFAQQVTMEELFHIMKSIGP